MNDFLSPNSYLREKITLFNWSAPRQACCNEEGGSRSLSTELCYNKCKCTHTSGIRKLGFVGNAGTVEKVALFYMS